MSKAGKYVFYQCLFLLLFRVLSNNIERNARYVKPEFVFFMLKVHWGNRIFAWPICENNPIEIVWPRNNRQIGYKNIIRNKYRNWQYNCNSNYNCKYYIKNMKMAGRQWSKEVYKSRQGPKCKSNIHVLVDFIRRNQQNSFFFQILWNIEMVQSLELAWPGQFCFLYEIERVPPSKPLLERKRGRASLLVSSVWHLENKQNHTCLSF